MSGSAKVGLLGLLLMIVFVAVVWDRGNERDMERQATEVIVLPEPRVLASAGSASSAPVQGEEVAIRSTPEEKSPAGGRAPETPATRGAPPPDAGQGAIDRLAKALFPPTPPRVEIVADRSEGGAGEYTVREGDTLWWISKRVYGDGSRWASIHEANRERIADPDRLVAGTRLTIPGSTATVASTRSRAKPYVVRKGDTLYGIARSTLGDGKQWERILKANQGRIPDPGRLEPGTRILIPAGRSPRGAR